MEPSFFFPRSSIIDMPPNKLGPSVIAAKVLANLSNHPNVPPHCWYLVVATALSVLNQPHGIRDVYKYEVDQCGEGDSLFVLRRMREALIKASAISGVPKVSWSSSAVASIQ